LLFCAPLFLFDDRSCELIRLQVYGALWAGWVTVTARIASSPILKTIEEDILPELSETAVERICADLERRYSRKRVLASAWTLGAAGAIAAGYLVDHDLATALLPLPSIWQILIWCLGWMVLYAAAAKVVNVSQLYLFFALNLADTPKGLYLIDPARSPLVLSVARLAQTMLWFWLAIAVSIALAIPFGIDFTQRALLPLDRNLFVGLDVLAIGTVSIGLGTVIFLQCEAAMRRSVRKVTYSTLRLIEEEAAKLLQKIAVMNDADWKRLSELDALRDEVVKAGSYRSVIASGLSVLVPFIVPIATLIFQRS
jgi:hypothetical protein